MKTELFILSILFLISFNIVAQEKTKLTKDELQVFAKRQDSLKSVQKKEILNHQAPDFDVTTIEGERYLLSALKGKVIVLNFWFTTCSPCIKEIQKFNQLFRDFKNDDIVCLSLCTDSQEKLEKFMKTNKLPFMFEIVANARAVAQKYKVTSYPCNIIIDKKGIVKYIKMGYTPNSVLVLRKKALKELR